MAQHINKPRIKADQMPVIQSLILLAQETLCSDSEEAMVAFREACIDHADAFGKTSIELEDIVLSIMGLT